MISRRPYAGPRQTIGLLGGSFDPPHAGHVHISREALKRFHLDRVWWLVSPGNPLKSQGPAPIGRRLRAARELVCDPRIVVTDLENRIGTRYTAATLQWLLRRNRATRFVWLMGADNLAQFHQWGQWRWIMRTIPIGVMARPGQRLAARTSRTATQFEAFRLPAHAAPLLARAEAPAWCLINVPMIDVSSSEIRARGEWPQTGNATAED